MNKTKIKNLIIILLVLVNVFLLEIVVSNALREKQASRSRNEALTAILSDNGISLSQDVELPESCGRIITLERSLRKEKSMLQPLIGTCSYADQGGDIFIFTGEDGSASISSSGEIKIALNSPMDFSDEDLVSSSKAVLKKIGIEYDEQSIETSVDDGLDCVTATCVYNGSIVLNAKINLYYSDGRLVFITGRRPPDERVGTAVTDKDLDGVAIIMAFLESIRQSGQVCSEITDITTVYILDSASVGANTLTPVWRIETNTGAYYFDGVTGKSRTPEA